MLLRTAPREVYRLYDEEAFLAAADEPAWAEDGAAGSPVARVAGVATLLGVLGAIGTLIVLHGGSGLAPRRRPVGGEHWSAAARNRFSADTLRGGVRARMSAAPAHLHARRRPVATQRERVVRAPASRPSRGFTADVSAPPAPAPPAPRPVAVAAAGPPPAAAQRSASEFGFER